MRTALVLDAIELRRPGPKRIANHSGRGQQFLSIRANERLDAADIDPSIGGIGASNNNALVVTVNGLHKAGVFHETGA